MEKKLRVVVLACLAALVLVIPPAAQANDTVCGIPGVPVPIVLTGGPHDNVVVPEGGRCFIQFAVIRGNVKALPDSLLTMVFSEVGGNVLGDKADMMQVFLNTIGQDIHVKEGGPNPLDAQEVNVGGNQMLNGDILVEKMTIAKGLLVTGDFGGVNQVVNGNVVVQENHSLPSNTQWSVDQNQIRNGNLHVFKNTGLVVKNVTRNVVTNGDIQCYENQPPFIGAPNAGRAPNQPPFMIPPLSGHNQCVGTST
jgi:hypothetical protein